MQVVTRASAGVALGDVVLRALMDTSYVDLVFLEQEMQLMVKDAVAAKSRGDEGATMTTNAGVMHGVGFASPDAGKIGRELEVDRDVWSSGNPAATETVDLSSGGVSSRGTANGAKTKSLVEAAAAQKNSTSIVNATVDLTREEKHDVRYLCCVVCWCSIC